MDFRLWTWSRFLMMAGFLDPLIPLSLLVSDKLRHAYKPEETKMLHASVGTSRYVLEPGLAASHILTMV
jgi:hypothetical protein